MDNIVYEIEKIVRKCGKKLLKANYKKLQIKTKMGVGNIVTKYDKDIQKQLKKELLNLLPIAVFVGEEDDSQSKITEQGYTFIVDPIDGTMNFSRNISLSAISVALLKDGEPYIGVCYNPYLDEMFMAQKNKGAYLNKKPIKVSDKTLKEGIVLTGNAPYYKELRKETLEIFCKFTMIASDFRRLGSAVIELCYVACGRAEVYFELKLQPWDFAAGILIVEEAGGKVLNINNEKITFNEPNSLIASNNKEDYLKYL